MSVNPNQTNATPATSLFVPSATLLAGITAISTTTTVVTIPVSGMVSTGTFVMTYVHPGGGGASQYVSNIVEGTNQVQVTMAAATANGESIQWIAKTQ
jgi:hypothetical protein